MHRYLTILLFSISLSSLYAVDLKTEGVDSAYLKTVVGRAQKIVDNLGLTNEQQALNVRNIIANRYILLNGIHDTYDEAMKKAKELSGDEKKTAQQQAADARDAMLYKHHFELESDLSNFLTPEQIEAVKDGLTYGVVKVTYDAQTDLIPTLTEEEKAQIMAWLKEAREFAMDAGNSKDKHNWFGKYKGRINNWLSQRGYDLTQEREKWYKRIEERKQKEAK